MPAFILLSAVCHWQEFSATSFQDTICRRRLREYVAHAEDADYAHMENEDIVVLWRWEGGLTWFRDPLATSCRYIYIHIFHKVGLDIAK